MPCNGTNFVLVFFSILLAGGRTQAPHTLSDYFPQKLATENTIKALNKFVTKVNSHLELIKYFTLQG